VRKNFLSFGIVLALFVMFFTTTAFTNAPTVRAATQPHKIACTPGWRTSGYVLTNTVDIPDGTPGIIVNNTDQTVSRTVSTTTTASVSASVSYTQDVSETQVLISEKESLGITIQGSVTIVRGESTTFSVSPHKSVRYGDYIRTDTFTYQEYYLDSACNVIQDNGYLTFTAPQYKIWEVDNI
jgi:hypothetical protein